MLILVGNSWFCIEMKQTSIVHIEIYLNEAHIERDVRSQILRSEHDDVLLKYIVNATLIFTCG